MNFFSFLFNSRVHRGGTLTVGILLVFLVTIFQWRKLDNNPDFIFLTDEAPGHWILYPSPVNLVAGYNSVQFAMFRTSFNITDIPEDISLSFQALSVSDVYLNEEQIYKEADGPEYWKTVHDVALEEYLKPGTNELQFNVANMAGPAILWTGISGLGLGSDESWETSQDGETWINAGRADTARWSDVGRDFPRAQDAFWDWLPWMGIPLGLVLILSLLLRTYPIPETWHKHIFSPGSLRWVLLILLVIMGARNLGQLKLIIGMDSSYHYDYMRYLLEHHRLLPVVEGFRGPLPYFLYALVHTIFSWFTSSEHADLYVRIIPIGCGLLQVELSYRTMRLLYPEQKLVQTAGLLVGGMLPMGVYMSQVISDEVVAAAFGSLALYLGFRLVARQGEAGYGTIFLMGSAAGLALLSKFNLVLILPALLICILLWCSTKPDDVVKGFMGVIAAFVPILTISGWFYVRNYLEVGQFFVGGWDSVIGIDWWQHPGYHTSEYFLRFGQTFQWPVYSVVASFWDGLYSAMWMDSNLSGMASLRSAPPWNLTPMLAGAYWGMIPTLLLIGGTLSAIWAMLMRKGDAFRSHDWASLLSVMTLGIFGAAILYLVITVPFYACTKPTHFLGATPALAVLAARGMACLPQRIECHYLVLAGLGCWGITVYCSYFVI